MSHYAEDDSNIARDMKFYKFILDELFLHDQIGHKRLRLLINKIRAFKKQEIEDPYESIEDENKHRRARSHD